MAVDIKSIISEITAKKDITNISFAGCGGSLVCFHAPNYYVQHESKKLSTSYTSANEFVHDTPACVGPNSIVVVASRRGNTAETVEAAKVARSLGATVIALVLRHDDEAGKTPLEEAADYTVLFWDGPGVSFHEDKGAYALKIAYELVNALEHNTAKYEAMTAGMDKMDAILSAAKEAIVPEAVKFSIGYKDDKVIYTMGSGTAWGAAHQEAICIFMEMQWINSSVIHTGEFFHGPFEITDPDTAYLLLKSTGKTRPVDDRAIRFLNMHNRHLTVIDGMDYGMGQLGEVSEYFDASFNTAMLGVFNKLLADMREHPLSKRKYMWKYNY